MQFRRETGTIESGWGVYIIYVLALVGLTVAGVLLLNDLFTDHHVAASGCAVVTER